MISTFNLILDPDFQSGVPFFAHLFGKWFTSSTQHDLHHVQYIFARLEPSVAFFVVDDVAQGIYVGNSSIPSANGLEHSWSIAK